MIERVTENGNKVVETYNSRMIGANHDPYPAGVSQCITANNTSYGSGNYLYKEFGEFDDDNNGVNNKTAGYSQWFLYGFEQGTEIHNLANYITVTNNGYYKVFKNGVEQDINSTASIGTGTVIKVYSSDNVFAEQFVVVIYGDLDGSGVVTTSDYNMALLEANSPSWADSVSYMFRAANLDQSSAFSTTDVNWFGQVVDNRANIDQVTGRAYAT